MPRPLFKQLVLFEKETKYFTFNQQCAGNNHEVGNQHNEIAKACKINSSRVHYDI